MYRFKKRTRQAIRFSERTVTELRARAKVLKLYS